MFPHAFLCDYTRIDICYLSFFQRPPYIRASRIFGHAKLPRPRAVPDPPPTSTTMVKVVVEFGGGLDLLFGKVKHLDLELDEKDAGMRGVISLLATKHLKERPELFVDGDTVRPGILTLINDADWELEGKLDYRLQDGDVIAFISTLHGG
jgi:ubiquitin related modifier 1